MEGCGLNRNRMRRSRKLGGQTEKIALFTEKLEVFHFFVNLSQFSAQQPSLARDACALMWPHVSSKLAASKKRLLLSAAA
jgi:hypothetical protein